MNLTPYFISGTKTKSGPRRYRIASPDRTFTVAPPRFCTPNPSTVPCSSYSNIFQATPVSTEFAYSLCVCVQTKSTRATSHRRNVAREKNKKKLMCNIILRARILRNCPVEAQRGHYHGHAPQTATLNVKQFAKLLAFRRNETKDYLAQTARHNLDARDRLSRVKFWLKTQTKRSFVVRRKLFIFCCNM